MPAWVATLIGAAIALLALLGTWIVQSRATARIEGGMVATLQQHGDSIREIKDEQVRQWQDIGDHGKKISALETKTAHL